MRNLSCTVQKIGTGDNIIDFKAFERLTYFTAFKTFTDKGVLFFLVSVNVTSSATLGPDGQVFIAGGDGEIIALKQKDGAELWRTKIGSVIFVSSPRLSTNGMLYIGVADKPGPLVALNYETGDIMWRMDTQGPIVGTPLITKKYSARYF